MRRRELTLRRPQMVRARAPVRALRQGAARAQVEASEPAARLPVRVQAQEWEWAPADAVLQQAAPASAVGPTMLAVEEGLLAPAARLPEPDELARAQGPV